MCNISESPGNRGISSNNSALEDVDTYGCMVGRLITCTHNTHVVTCENASKVVTYQHMEASG